MDITMGPFLCCPIPMPVSTRAVTLDLPWLVAAVSKSLEDFGGSTVDQNPNASMAGDWAFRPSEADMSFTLPTCSCHIPNAILFFPFLFLDGLVLSVLFLKTAAAFSANALSLCSSARSTLGILQKPSAVNAQTVYIVPFQSLKYWSGAWKLINSPRLMGFSYINMSFIDMIIMMVIYLTMETGLIRLMNIPELFNKVVHFGNGLQGHRLWS
ncbi:unnamed protein product [Sordaria macrospora k-hell]|uniref:WGS project CABT00000000 data, contig 2.29 n=1 Tax=Sordaria macrospora (strain ATCC MYA-333 / DSM 997 / K(L3346) / K-hell) TaxID=771870 RepID=F7W509_SORMK|nr:uncharacterized protein SMAC_07004 [Sordaria macrospora k-hell]CCC12597.1 unnamed protein product [Sordaria macrospora k-hell]